LYDVQLFIFFDIIATLRHNIIIIIIIVNYLSLLTFIGHELFYPIFCQAEF